MRSEYWYWVLFIILAVIVLQILTVMIYFAAILLIIFHLGTILPGIAVSVRRLHDVDKSGWLLLIGLIPLIGALVLLYFMVQPGTPAPNRFRPECLPHGLITILGGGSARE